MHINDFMAICEQATIDPVLASEDDGVKTILKTPTSDDSQRAMLINYFNKNF
jgi:hypothetical protein